MASAVRKAVFLDRDGVINETVLVDGDRMPPRTVNEFRLIDGVADAVDRLRLAGFALIVVTNQPDVARGNQSTIVIEAMHEKLRSLIAIDDIVTCVHDDADACAIAASPNRACSRVRSFATVSTPLVATWWETGGAT